MMGMKFFTSAIAVYRTFSTKSSRKTTKFSQSGYKSSTKHRKFIPKSREPIIKWTHEQEHVLAHVAKGHSVFVTGSAGTGKTVLLKHIIKILKKAHGRSRVFVTASTGVAACALDGQTLHSFAGIGFPNVDRGTLLDRVVMNGRACKRWKNAKTLVIDEISMIDANLFENLEYIARQIRESNEVWAGIQLIVCGDFFQLPPVADKWKRSGNKFAFEADCWKASFGIQVELTRVFRQSDARLIKLLQGIRKGETDAEDLKLLESCFMNKPDSLAVRLYPLNEDVKKVNEERMEILGEKVFIYEAADGGMDYQKKRLKQGIVPEQLVLCKDARVMLIKNLKTWHRLCNGATGTVTRFVKVEDKDVSNLCPDNLLPVVKFDFGLEIVIEPQTFDILEEESVVAWRCQIPLMLAWAVSIHKCQGMTLDHVYTDLSRAFGFGMVYVALSRVRNLEGLHLSGLSPSKIKAHPKVLHFYQSLADAGKNEDEDVDDNANKNKDSGSNILDQAGKTSIQVMKYHFSLHEFLLSRQLCRK